MNEAAAVLSCLHVLCCVSELHKDISQVVLPVQ